MTSTELSQTEVKDLVTQWFVALDRHDPLADVLTMLVDEPLTMRFPEGTVYGHKGFTEWYETVTNKFFDESHELRHVTVRSPGSDGSVEVDLLVNWKASIWSPPAAKSERVDFDATQNWTVGRSVDGVPEITTYTVQELRQLPGSASL